MLEISDHLHYEIWMFESAAEWLASNSGKKHQQEENAWLECFAIHARVLMDFLYDDLPERDDVVADDFLHPDIEWKRPILPKLLQRFNERVNKQIVHLTYTRRTIGQEMKQWPFQEISREILSILRTFLQVVPDSRLSGQLKAYKSQRGKLASQN